MVTLQQLRYLIALDDCRHFGRAAEQCFVAQPTLTTQIKKLESSLNVQLLDRSKNPIKPTIVGQKVIAHARIVLDDVKALHAAIYEETAALKGRYVLGIIPTLAPYLLPLFIQDFSLQFPEIELVIQELQSEQIIEGLQRNQIDIGLLVTPLEERQLREIALFYEPLLVYAAPSEAILKQSPLLPADLDHRDLWLLQQGHCFRNQVLNLCQGRGERDITPSTNYGTATSLVKNEHTRSFTFQAGSIETLKNMVKNNLGYTIVPEMSIDDKLDKLHLKRFADPQPAREVSLVVNKTFAREKLLVELRKAILKVVPSNFKKNERFMSVVWR